MGGCDAAWVFRAAKMPANGDAEVGRGAGMKANLAPAGMVSRFVRSKEWQNCVAGGAAEAAAEAAAAVVVVVVVVSPARGVAAMLCAGGV